MFESHLHVTYMPVRGRCEPIFLMLVDSGAKFTKEFINLDKWIEMKGSGMAGPPRFPYSGLPVLRVAESEGQKGFMLGETTAIIAFLDEYLQRGARETPSLQTRVQMQMIRDASLYFLDRVFQMSAKEDWLGPKNRNSVLQYIAKPYLAGTESTLAIHAVRIIPSASDQVNGTGATVFTALLFILNLFPSLKSNFQPGGDYPICGELYRSISERPKVKSWYREEGIMRMAWTVTAYGTAEWIASEAEKYDAKSDI